MTKQYVNSLGLYLAPRAGIHCAAKDWVPWLPTDTWFLSTLWEQAAGERKQYKLAVSMRQGLQSWLYFIISHDIMNIATVEEVLSAFVSYQTQVKPGAAMGSQFCCPKNHVSSNYTPPWDLLLLWITLNKLIVLPFEILKSLNSPNPTSFITAFQVPTGNLERNAVVFIWCWPSF